MMQRPHHVSRIVAAAANTNATVAKKSNGTLFGASGYNAAATVRYLKIYNKSTTPDENDTPILTIALPPTTGFGLDWSSGIAFSLGISYRMVTGSADNDTGALTANDVVGLNVIYE